MKVNKFLWILFLKFFSGFHYFCVSSLCAHWALQVAQWIKNPPAMQETQETWVRSLGQEDPWMTAWQSISVFLPGESYGQRSLVSYSPWAHKESDSTEVMSVHEHTVWPLRRNSSILVRELCAGVRLAKFQTLPLSLMSSITPSVAPVILSLIYTWNQLYQHDLWVDPNPNAEILDRTWLQEM